MGDEQNRIRELDAYHKRVMSQNFFEVLGVSADTAPAEIRSRYLRLAKKWHSDAFSGVSLGPRAEKLDAVFARIQEAYETLSDAGQLAEYRVRLERESKGLSNDVNAILRSEQVYDEGLALLRKQDFKGAEAKLGEARKLNPEDPLFSVSWAWAHYQAQTQSKAAADAAVKVLTAAVGRQPNLAVAYQYLGAIQFAAERYDDAKRWWRKCLEFDRNNIEAARGLRLVERRAQQPKKKEPLGFLKRLLGR